ncbi:MAG: DsbA family protein [Gemmatimonadota bacterium]|nr:DsbA family protein [Gemmatimonadota bacterium]
MSSSRIAALAGLPLIAVLALGARPAPPAPGGPATAPDSILRLADAGRIQGSPSAKVWLVEASDFQCPFCKEWHDQSYEKIVKDYVATGKVRFAFLNDPLSMHVHSMQAAEAGMCASAQGQFWPMHQLLFGSQDRWADLPDVTAYFDTLARKAGVDLAAWRGCVRTHATRPMIEADQARLRASDVQSTPTFCLGSEKIVGAAPTATFVKALDSALARAGAH